MTVVGAHVAGEFGLLSTFDRVEELGLGCFQMFIGASNSYFPYHIGPKQAIAFRQKKADLNIKVAAHGPYMPNVCSSKRWDASIKSIVAYMRAANELAIDFMVFHPGSHLGEGMQQGRENLIKATEIILDETASLGIKLLWENTAGGGTQVGHVQVLAEVVAYINERDALGMCLDTTHAYADQHPLDVQTYRTAFWERFGGVTDWVHFNNPDRKVKLGCHLDRHRQNWLEAKWPVEVMLDIAREWGPSVPLCMEAAPDAYDVNLMLLDEAGVYPC